MAREREARAGAYPERRQRLRSSVVAGRLDVVQRQEAARRARRARRAHRGEGSRLSTHPLVYPSYIQHPRPSGDCLPILRGRCSAVHSAAGVRDAKTLSDPWRPRVCSCLLGGPDAVPGVPDTSVDWYRILTPLGRKPAKAVRSVPTSGPEDHQLEVWTTKGWVLRVNADGDIVSQGHGDEHEQPPTDLVEVSGVLQDEGY